MLLRLVVSSHLENVDAACSLPEKGKAIQKAVDVLNRLPSVSENDLLYEYDRLAANCRISFCLCYLGEEQEAVRILNEVSPPVITSEEYNHPLLTNIFAGIQYGFSVVSVSNTDR